MLVSGKLLYKPECRFQSDKWDVRMGSDDVVFLIFLYQVRHTLIHLLHSGSRGHGWRLIQRWIYRIDPKRVNEYGQVLVNDVDDAPDSKGESKKSR